MGYNEYISKILNERGNIIKNGEYHETHHIIPRCLGGTNDKSNLIDLYPKEHYTVHKLLYLEHPDNEKLAFAKPNICKCLKGIRKHCGKHPLTGEKLTWKYLNSN